ncbi:MAG: hypothetical protein FJ290_17465 [Planctomycetes bacterium]|nr:hypothetical protein [Planctomycetota bacterium]
MAYRKAVLIVVAVVAMLWLLAPAGMANCGNCPGDKPKPPTVDGTVKGVNAEARTLVLTVGSGDEAKDVTMKVCPKAKIVIDGKDATLADVKAGAKAKVTHVKTDSGDLVAVNIAVGECCPK